VDLPGKEAPAFMERVYSNLGRPSKRVVVGPGTGLDNAIVSVGHGRVMIVTVDPVSAIPEFGMRLSGWLSVHLIASDYTASGADPELATFSYNFPPSMARSEREEFIHAIGSECKNLGVAIIGGNTGTYPGAGFTVVGTGSMLGFAQRSGYVAPSMAKVGDVVLMTKHAAIEATGSLALSFPNFLERAVGKGTAARARKVIHSCSTVEDARVVRRIGLGGGALTSMHDATEGGILGALEEMAQASRHSFRIKPSRIPVSDTAAKVCRVFGLDPLKTMGEGSLLITCGPGAVPELERYMSRSQIPITEIGSVEGGDGILLLNSEGRARRFVRKGDRYWAAYNQALRRRLS
jgi:hydrogenase expression/formation protein HypE